ncbi:MAG: ComEC/Rec2 family competence protein [Parvularculaceae bacterium]
MVVAGGRLNNTISAASDLRVRAAALSAGFRAMIAADMARDAGRTGLWAPVAFGAGAAAYLTMAREPAFWLAPLLMAAAIALAARVERWRPAAMAAALAAAGFASADLRTAMVGAPILAGDTGFVTVAGRIASVDEAAKQRRLVIDVHSVSSLAPEATPARVRLSWRGKAFNARPGDVVSVRAKLSPPPPPVAPGGFDFARQLYFQRIGAVGFMVTPPWVDENAPHSTRHRIAAAVEGARVALARRIMAKAPGDGGAIVAAVITGKREGVSQKAEAALRDSGLAHLLAISGLHMGLATGLIFFTVRGALALNEALALRYPIKKWAALAALFSGAGYLVLSGGAWSAQRAFIMSSIMFAAILNDRRALSLRNVAIAALVILAMRPEAVLHPGFQMSFAAVTALIAAYEWASRRADPNRSFTTLARARRYVVGVAATDTIAALATAPYSLFHFNRAANFGLPANVISIPVMGFWVMPAAIIALALTPLGLDGPAWRAAAAGVEAILTVATWTSSLPGAVSVVAHWPGAALALVTLGGLWLCLMAGRWRIAGIAALPAAVVMSAYTPRTDIFIADGGDNVGVVMARANSSESAREFVLYDRRRSRFAATAWKEFAGMDTRRAPTGRLADVARCDDGGCAAIVKTARVAVSNAPQGFDDDCARADLVIALYPVDPDARRACPATVLDRRAAWREGAHAITIGRDGKLAIRSVAAARGQRPWTAARAG